MYRLCSHQEIGLAQTTMHSFRSTLNNTKQTAVGPQAREQLRVLSSQVNAASIAVDVLRSDIHNPQAKALVTEYERLEKTAREIVDALTTGAQYDGERRDAMTARQKSDYISKNGSEQFFQLPR